jgi:hypothetical protein
MSFVMQAFTLNGVNGSVTLDANGVTIVHRIYGKQRHLGWQDLAGATIKKGTFFARPKLYVLSNQQLAFVKSDFSLLNDHAATQMDDWAIFFSTGEEAHWQALLRAINTAAASFKREHVQRA